MFLNKNKFGIAWTLLILLVCLMPGDNLPSSSFLSFKGADKVIHSTLYLVLIILVGSGLVNYFHSSYSRNRIFVIAFLYCLFLGVGATKKSNTSSNGLPSINNLCESTYFQAVLAYEPTCGLNHLVLGNISLSFS